MENTDKKMPLNRDDFCNRYGISKPTFKKWLRRANIEKEIPNIREIRVFNINQSKILLEKFG